MKYLVAVIDSGEAMFTFPKTVDHDRMAESLERIRFGGERNWDRKLFKGVERGTIVSAGFISNGTCHGRSETLDLDCRPITDTALFRAQYGSIPTPDAVP